MKKIFMFLFVLVVLLGFSFQANANLTVIGYAEYEGVNYNLIWDDDAPFGSVVWLDYTNSPNTWYEQINWAAGLKITSHLLHSEAANG